MRDEDEKFQEQSEKRKEQSRKQAIESLGFQYEGDYKVIYKEMERDTGQKNPYFKSSSDFNNPNHKNYGKKSTRNSFTTTVGEIFQIYDKYINLLS